MIRKFKGFFELAESQLGEITFWNKITLVKSFLVCKIVTRAGKKEFFQYKMQEKNALGCDKFITNYRKDKFVKAVNNQADSIYFNDKSAFAEKFSSYIGRDTLDMVTATKIEFSEFVKIHNPFFVKPKDGFFGYGAGIKSYETESDIDSIYDELSGKGIVIEEIIRQSEEMAQFNDTSVNTLRMVTFLLSNNTPVLMPGAAIRMGRKGKYADNFHHQGIGAQIDINTGVVCTTGIDKTGTRYVLHPDSGKQIVGFKVPHWEEVCETVKQAALVVPSVRYVGWDVVITKENKIALIEGNCMADPDLAQMSDGTGKWLVYKKYMDEVLRQK